jgi:mono/diheme cytochrome c family protein
MVLTSCKKLIKRGMKLGLGLVLVAGLAPSLALAEQAPDATAVAPAEEAVAPVEAEPVEPGDAGIGRLYFMGAKRFTNGGPACISCHSAGVGSLGGGVLGPNLTKVYADPSKNPLLNSVWINNPGTPVMGPVFSNRNITDEEVGHLRAFFQQQSKGDVASSKTGAFTIISIGGFIGILIIFNIIWAGRYRSRNNGTAHDALWRNYGGKGGR